MHKISNKYKYIKEKIASIIYYKYKTYKYFIIFYGVFKINFKN